MINITSQIFFLPDYTVGLGISPSHVTKMTHGLMCQKNSFCTQIPSVANFTLPRSLLYVPYHSTAAYGLQEKYRELHTVYRNDLFWRNTGSTII